ncbi:MAG: ScyD/ScyE family protein [Jatrophihabitans sp.]
MNTTRGKAGAVAVFAAVGVGVLTVGVTPAYAHNGNGSHSLRVVKTLSSAYVGPLQFAVAGRYVFVADSFTSTLNLIGRSKPLASGPGDGGDIAGVAVDQHRLALAYTSSNADHSTTTLTILQAGRKKVVADLSGFERTRNPDGRTHYGIDKPTKCVADALTALGIPVQYTGMVDSHPYAVTSLGDGAWAVADAGGNDVVKVDRRGHVSLLTVLPRQGVKISKVFAAANGLPDCAIGFTYNFEPVATDVEVGPGGSLYATTLPGGPEGPNNGNPGSVYEINQYSGKNWRFATGFNGATNLAIDKHGTVYVAEISSGTISQAYRGGRVQVMSLPGVVGLEYANGHLYASTAPAASGGDGPGTVVQLGR